MRTQAIEKLLKLMMRYRYEDDTMDQLVAKATIVLDRSNNQSASVIRELINGELK